MPGRKTGMKLWRVCNYKTSHIGSLYLTGKVSWNDAPADGIE